MNFPHIRINEDGEIIYRLDAETARELAYVLDATKDRGWQDDGTEIHRLLDEYETLEEQ